MYDLLPYYISKIVIEMPILLALPMLENVITFNAIGYNTANDNFFRFYIVYFVTCQAGTAIGYFISCSFDNMMTAAQVTPFASMISVLFGGLVVNLTTLDKELAWV